jgi:hypothetical protein
MISIVISISVLILKKIDILTLKKEDFWGKKWSMILILDQDHFFDIIWSWSDLRSILRRWSWSDLRSFFKWSFRGLQSTRFRARGFTFNFVLVLCSCGNRRYSKIGVCTLPRLVRGPWPWVRTGRIFRQNLQIDLICLINWLERRNQV